VDVGLSPPPRFAFSYPPCFASSSPHPLLHEFSAFRPYACLILITWVPFFSGGGKGRKSQARSKSVVEGWVGGWFPLPFPPAFPFLLLSRILRGSRLIVSWMPRSQSYSSGDQKLMHTAYWVNDQRSVEKLRHALFDTLTTGIYNRPAYIRGRSCDYCTPGWGHYEWADCSKMDTAFSNGRIWRPTDPKETWAYESYYGPRWRANGGTDFGNATHPSGIYSSTSFSGFKSWKEDDLS